MKLSKFYEKLNSYFREQKRIMPQTMSVCDMEFIEDIKHNDLYTKENKHSVIKLFVSKNKEDQEFYNSLPQVLELEESVEVLELPEL